MEDQNRCEMEIDLNQVNQNERPVGSWLCCLPCYWLKRNSGFHKLILSVVTLVVTVLLVASPVLFLISSIPGEKSRSCSLQGNICGERESVKICVTEECSQAKSRILASMSWKANPCQDFYQFACGSWKEKPKVSDQAQTKYQQDHLINFVTLQHQVNQNIKKLLTVNANSDPFRKLGTFYKSCIREKDKKTSFLSMFALLEELGGYVGPTEVPREDLTDLVLNLLRLNGAPLFDIYLDSDLDNSSKLAPFIDLPLHFGINLASKHHCHSSEGCFPMKSFFAEKDFSEIYSRNGKQDEGSYNKAYNFIKASIEEKRLLVMEKIIQDFMPRNFSSRTKINETQITLHFANIITKLYPREKEVIKGYQGESNMKMTAQDLERKFPFIRWRYLLEQFLKLKISHQDQVFVLIPDYMETLQRSLHRFPSRVIHNGLLLIFATDTLYELVNTSSTRDWSSFCSQTTVNAFGQAVSILYVRQFGQEYVEKLRTRVTIIFNTLKKSFRERIEKISWIDEKSKKAIFQKLSDLQIQFLNWPNYWNASYANSLMREVQVHPEDFFGNVIQRYRQLRNVTVNFKREQSEEKRWAYPFVVNAFYILTLNTIMHYSVWAPLVACANKEYVMKVYCATIINKAYGQSLEAVDVNLKTDYLIIPLALLTQPYFKEDLPLYIPYSTLGLIIAHEILHGFDLKGINHDSKGNTKVLMSQDSRAKFEARLDCFVKQFSSSFWKKVYFLGTNVDIQFDWNMTKNENMADISGLQMAYQAWKSVSEPESGPYLPGINLNPPQLFFLNAAQTYCTVLSPADYIFLVEADFHTPQPERVNGMMMNSPGFSEAYKCPLGSPMNPRKKCSTW